MNYWMIAGVIVAWLALLGFTEDDGLFFSLGAVVFGLSRVIGVLEEEV